MCLKKSDSLIGELTSSSYQMEALTTSRLGAWNTHVSLHLAILMAVFTRDGFSVLDGLTVG